MLDEFRALSSDGNVLRAQIAMRIYTCKLEKAEEDTLLAWLHALPHDQVPAMVDRAGITLERHPIGPVLAESSNEDFLARIYAVRRGTEVG